MGRNKNTKVQKESKKGRDNPLPIPPVWRPIKKGGKDSYKSSPPFFFLVQSLVLIEPGSGTIIILPSGTSRVLVDQQIIHLGIHIPGLGAVIKHPTSGNIGNYP